jgi:hypothetical protein
LRSIRECDINRLEGWRHHFGERVIKPRLKPAIALVILSIPLACAIVGYGMGRQNIVASNGPGTARVQVSMPPSTVIHPPMICRNGVCAELKASAP